MTLKYGDRVRIKATLERCQDDPGVDEGMTDYCGKTASVRSVVNNNKGIYTLNIGGVPIVSPTGYTWNWHKSWLKKVSRGKINLANGTPLC